MKILICTILLLFIAAVPVRADDTVSVTIDGVAVAFPGGLGPVIEDERTLVPVRGVFEHLGFEVGWLVDTRTAVIYNDTYTLRITIDSYTFTVNGVAYTLDVPARLIGERTMVPIRLPLEAVGYNIGWDVASRTVLISAASAAFEPSYFERRVLELTNEERARYSLSPLAHYDTLAALARAHSTDMAIHDNMSHTGSDGRVLRQRIDDAGISWWRIAENVAAGQRTPEAVVTAWMNSPGHRANILQADLTHLGVGLHRLEGTRFVYYWTQKFAALR
jgi:hypothetical protein